MKVKGETWNTHQWLSNPRCLAVEPHFDQLDIRHSSWVSRGNKLLVRSVGDGLKVQYFDGQISQDRRRQREHHLPPSRRQLRADIPEILVPLGCQSLTLTLDRFFVGHECDYDTSSEPRPSLALRGQDILADCGALR